MSLPKLQDTQGSSIAKSSLRLVIDKWLDDRMSSKAIMDKLKAEHPGVAFSVHTLRAYKKNFYTFERSKLISAFPPAATAVAAAPASSAVVAVPSTIEADVTELYSRIERIKQSCRVTRPNDAGQSETRDIVDVEKEALINNYYKTIAILREQRQKYRLEEVVTQAHLAGASAVAEIAVQVFIPLVIETQRRSAVDTFKSKLVGIMSAAPVAKPTEPTTPPDEQSPT